MFFFYCYYVIQPTQAITTPALTLSKTMQSIKINHIFPLPCTHPFHPLHIKENPFSAEINFYCFSFFLFSPPPYFSVCVSAEGFQVCVQDRNPVLPGTLLPSHQHTLGQYDGQRRNREFDLLFVLHSLSSSFRHGLEPPPAPPHTHTLLTKLWQYPSYTLCSTKGVWQRRWDPFLCLKRCLQMSVLERFFIE